jgi:ribosomal protein L37AE/L43A
MIRTAFIDDQLAARDFNTGDMVRKPGFRGLLLSPYVGRVLFSNVDTGMVSVQWPWGEEQERAVELIRDMSGDFLPATYDQAYSSWERTRYEGSTETVKVDKKWRESLAARIVRQYEAKTMPLYRTACKAMHRGMSEMEAFATISAALASIYGDDAVRRTVSNLYGTAVRLAIYWHDPKRRYRVTQKEKNSGVLSCPRCRRPLKLRTYRQGQKALQCRNCGFTIHPRDLIYPKRQQVSPGVVPVAQDDIHCQDRRR